MNYLTNITIHTQFITCPNELAFILNKIHKFINNIHITPWSQYRDNIIKDQLVLSVQSNLYRQQWWCHLHWWLGLMWCSPSWRQHACQGWSDRLQQALQGRHSNQLGSGGHRGSCGTTHPANKNNTYYIYKSINIHGFNKLK